MSEHDREMVEVTQEACRIRYNEQGRWWNGLSDGERKAVKEWVQANNIRPAFGVGDRIAYREHLGVINGIDEPEGRYLLKPDDETEKYERGGGICVPYEDAEAAQGTEAAPAAEPRSGSVHDGPVGNADAPNPNPLSGKAGIA